MKRLFSVFLVLLSVLSFVLGTDGSGLGFGSIHNNMEAYKEAKRVLAPNGIIIDVVRCHYGTRRRRPVLRQVTSDKKNFEAFLKKLGLCVERSEVLMTKHQRGKGTLPEWEDRVYYINKIIPPHG